MAGRPRTMAKRLAQLEASAFETYRSLEALRPPQHAARQGEEGDDLACAWNEACRALGMASIALSILLEYAEERAGLDWVALERQREQRRGLVPSEAAEDSTEHATGAAT